MKNINKILDKIISNTYTTEQIINKFCGKVLGRGQYRDVYELKANKNYVVKVEKNMYSCHFMNAREWKNYKVATKKMKKWLAPIWMINNRGDVSVQDKVKFKKPNKYPKKIPAFLHDIHYNNFGWLNGKFVCIDYPVFMFPPWKMKKAKWE